MEFKPLQDEETIFGTVFNDGSFSSLLPFTPTAAQIRELWSRYDNIFAHNVCEDCGHKSYAFSDRMKEDPCNPGHVLMHETLFFCPHCGRRRGYGGSFFRSQAILNVIRAELDSQRGETAAVLKDSDVKEC